MYKKIRDKIMVLLVMFFFVIPSLSPAQELFEPHSIDDYMELKTANNISPQQQIKIGNSGEVVVGEKLNPIDYGPGYVEHMDNSIARDLFQRSNLDVDLKECNSQQGIWIVPSREASYYPLSGKHYVINKWGDTKMGISFPTVVDIHGAWFAGQGGGEGVWANSIRVIGYMNGERAQITDWFDDIHELPTWFAINLQDVDRIVIEAKPVFNGAGWYAMDDLTYTPKIKNEQVQSATIVLDFEDCFYNQVLNSTNYAGLTWETGTGDFYINQDGMPTPRTLFNKDKKGLSELERYSSSSSGNDRAITPELISDFQGVIRYDAGSGSIPPDTCGAAGPNHFVEVVNKNFAVYNKSTGEELINILLGSFLPGSNGDPRVLYDQYSDRWFVIVSDFISRIYLAVSISDDPTGSWFKCNFVVSQGHDAGKWPDYPTLGVDDDGIYVAAYMVGGSNGMSIFALDKAPLIEPDPSLGTVFAFRELPYEGAIQPVHTFNTSDGEYFVSRMSSTSIRVRLLTNLTTNATLTELGSVTIPSHSVSPDAPALGSTTPLDTFGPRLMNAVYRNGYIWTAHCIGVGGRAASRWYKISVLEPSLADYGTVNDSVLYYFFPSIIVNSGGDVVMGFSGSHSGQYAAAYYTGRSANDPPGFMAPPVMLKEGEASYNLIDSSGRNRWGDYSLCSLDPINHTFWTIQEYAHSHNSNNEHRWGTWIGELSFNRPPERPNASDGPDEGITDVEYMFTSVTSDPDGDQIYYKFNWGDGEDSSWVGPYNSGEIGNASHVWEDAGDFSIKVKAKDDNGKSGWSPEHIITIITGPKLDIGIISGGLFKVKTSIKNTCSVDVENINWKITLDGGAFTGKETIGKEDIPAGGDITATSNLILGFGPTLVTIDAWIPDVWSDTRKQSGFVFLFFIKVNPGG